MQRRVGAVDLLRGLAIVGMVLSGQMLWHGELPRWMFHAQVPPPAFVFDPSVAGITWVDLVFPFFLFSMGAALPFALRKKEGVSGWTILRGGVHRWLWLTVFAVALGNTGLEHLSTWNSWVASLMTLVVWGLFFVAFVRLPDMDARRNRWMNWCGLGALIGYTALQSLWGVEVDLLRTNIIILILANMALFGTMIWWWTRSHIAWRGVIIAGIAVWHLSGQVEGSWTQDLLRMTGDEGLIRFEFLKYLCILLPGSIAGDVIYDMIHQGTRVEREQNTRVGAVAGILAVMFCGVMCGLYLRELWAVVLVVAVGSCVVGGLLQGLTTADAQMLRRLMTLSLVWMVVGLLAEPLEGGIKKDPATVGYFFITSALALWVVMMAWIAERHFGSRLKWIESTGENPMMAYTAAGHLLMPIVTLVGLAPQVAQWSAASPWCGVARGVAMCGLVVGVTVAFSRKKIVWKS